MSHEVLLKYPDFKQPFHIFTDASDLELGGVNIHKLTSSQCNYTTMEKDLILIVETEESHQNFLLGFKCNFHSDHKNLSFYNFKYEQVKHCRLLLEEYHYEFHYTPGNDNTITYM